MYNKIILVGRLTKQPELKYTQTGVAVCSFGLAVNRSYKDSNNNFPVDFFNITTWRKLAEISSKFLKKGGLVLIEGEMQSRKYQTQNGEQKTAWDVQANTMKMLGSKKEGEGHQEERSPQGNNQLQQDINQDDIAFDDIPF